MSRIPPPLGKGPLLALPAPEFLPGTLEGEGLSLLEACALILPSLLGEVSALLCWAPPRPTWWSARTLPHAAGWCRLSARRTPLSLTRVSCVFAEALGGVLLGVHLAGRPLFLGRLQR